MLKVRAGELDLDYLRQWAGELQVSDLLERALKDGGVIGFCCYNQIKGSSVNKGNLQ